MKRLNYKMNTKYKVSICISNEYSDILYNKWKINTSEMIKKPKFLKSLKPNIIYSAIIRNEKCLYKSLYTGMTDQRLIDRLKSHRCESKKKPDQNNYIFRWMG